MTKLSKTKIIFVIVLILFILPQISLAAPNISNISGTFADGQSVTIFGFDFRTGPTIYKWENFENGVDGEEIDKDDGWPDLTLPDPHYTNTNQRVNSTLSCYNSDGSQDLLYDHGGILSSVYTTFWIRAVRDCAEGECIGLNCKWLNLLDSSWLTGGGGDSDPLLTLIEQWSGPSPMINWRDYSGDPGFGYQGTNFYPLRRTNDVWERYELYATESTTTSGTVKFWGQIGGEGNTFTLLANHTNVQTVAVGTDHWTGVDFGMMSSGYDTPTWFDDIYIASSMARVEIGNNAIWENCTHREIQISVTWTDSSISFTANQGSFTNGQTVYLYVVDENGNVNASGYPITIGAGQPPDTTPPAAPTGVVVN